MEVFMTCLTTSIHADFDFLDPDVKSLFELHAGELLNW